MTTHRISVGDFDILIGHWRHLLAMTPEETAEHSRIVAKLQKLEDYRRQEFGTDEAWRERDGKER